MKDFLLYIKNLEKDFDLSERSYRSKIELGVTSLITSDYIKAKEMFDGAIEMDSDMPAGWIGKCFAEIALVSDDDFNDLMLDEYINRALRKSDELMNYRAALCGCLIYRHDQLINKYYNLRAKANNAAANAANNANLGVGAAAIGLALSGNRRSVASNIVGGALITGGISTAMIENANMNYFKNAGNEYDYLLMYQCLMSSPMVKFSSLFSDKVDNQGLVTLLKNTNILWSKTMKQVLKGEVMNFVDYVYDLKTSDLINLRREKSAAPIKRLMILQSIVKGESCEENMELNAIVNNNTDSEKIGATKDLDFQDENYFQSILGLKIVGYSSISIGLLFLFGSEYYPALFFTILGIIPIIFLFKMQNPKTLISVQQELKKFINKFYANSQQESQLTQN